MKINISPAARVKLAAFSLMEAMVGMGLLGTVVGALLSGFTTGFFHMQMARENLRATQIMLEKMETLRLYSWQQINSNGFIKPTFTEYYDPKATNSQGAAYTGTLTISPAAVGSSYSNDMKLVTVSINWKTGNIKRTRAFNSYVSKYGLQDYVY